MNVNGYEDDEYGNKNRILFWLRLDVWSSYVACLLMLDIDPDSVVWETTTQEKYFNTIKTFKGVQYSLNVGFESDDLYVLNMEQLYVYSKCFEDMNLTLSNKDNTKIKPIDWIELAVSKGISIPWLDVAIEIGIYPKPNTNEGSVAKTEPNNLLDKTNPNYPPELDIAIQAWHAVTNNPGKGKPKARIRAWLDQNTTLANEAKERISIVCNWDKLGGATRSD